MNCQPRSLFPLRIKPSHRLQRAVAEMIQLKASPLSYWEPRKQRVIFPPLFAVDCDRTNFFFFYHYHKQSLDVDICSVLLHDVRKKYKIIVQGHFNTKGPDMDLGIADPKVQLI